MTMDQMPSAPNSGPAPVPYGGSEQQPEPPEYGVTADIHAPGVDVMSGVSGNALQESGYAHDMNAGLVVPYQTAAISPVYVGGDADAGGRDTVSGTVAGAVANAEARFAEHLSDATNTGSGVIGDLMSFPAVTATGAPLDPGVAPGITDPSGGYYDPAREY